MQTVDQYPWRLAAWLLSLVLAQGCTAGMLFDDDGDGPMEDAAESSGGVFSPGDSGGGAGASAGGEIIQITTEPGRTTWRCSEGIDSCDCNVTSFLDERCELAWDCCLVSEDTCSCMMSADCAAEAASRPGSRVVATCPPDAELLASACAMADQNCTGEYLGAEDLSGCCDGLLCAPNEAGIRVCLPGSSEELAEAARCSDPRLGEALMPAGPLTSSAGDFTFASVDARLAMGPGGCLNTVSLNLGGATSLCQLQLEAGPARDAQGRLLVSIMPFDALFGLTAPCPGFPPELVGFFPTTGSVTGTLEFMGVSCEVGRSGQCASGRFELTLSGSIMSDQSFAEVPPVTFDDATIALDGRVCDTTADTICSAP